MTLIGWCPGGRTVADMLARYPGTRTVRIFVGANDPLPAWGGPILGPLGDVLPHVSFKRWDLPALTAWLDAMPAGRLLILTYAHEPEQGTDAGDPTVEQFRTRWAELVAELADHPRRGDVLLVPVYTRYWWQAHPGDQRWLVPMVDAYGWDIYNNGTTYRTPDDLLSIPRDIAARTGLPYLIAELGAVRIPGDDDGAGRTAWMRDMVAAARADGALTACWFHRLEWDLAPYAAEQQTWRELTQEDSMPTYTQLQAESWWGREVTTPAMDWLGDELCRRTGRPRDAAGTKGDNRHLRGAHRSQEWIRRSVYCTNRSYTVQSGLTAEQERHIAGFDFTPGSADDMVAQCKRLYAAMRAGYLDEVREFYGNVDGDQVVDGWDNVADRPASSDSSHLWHWHLSIDRRHCNNQALMERILAVALGEPLEEDMDQATFDKLLKGALTGSSTDAKAVQATIRALPWAYPVRPDASALNVLFGQSLPQLAAAVKGLGEAVARESSNPDEVRALLAELPQPAPVDVDGLAAALAERVKASLPQGDAITDEQLERVLRSALGSLDNPAS